ncbi:hypothetical protein DW968_17745 [Bacteroides fragilis]|jgi:hypothetical protein|nr:hypothetical protein [Bacteroides fragilis]MBD9189034.1 hypothetical protein [Bacteroides fragilis]RGZ83510.1 hypothetical protein DW968_17745 [Bacteroides fragilis]
MKIMKYEQTPFRIHINQINDIQKAPFFGCRKIVRMKFNPKPVKPLVKPLHSFMIKGVKIQAYSRRDALKRYNHLK